MRGLPVRRIASSALCATLLIGIAAPAAMAADSDCGAAARPCGRRPYPARTRCSPRSRPSATSAASSAPVTDLLDAALKADNGQLSADQATKLGDAVKAAVAKITAAAPAAPPAAAPAVPAAPARAAPCPRCSPRAPSDPRAQGAPPTSMADALAALQKAVDTLLEAVTSGDVAGSSRRSPAW